MAMSRHAIERVFLMMIFFSGSGSVQVKKEAGTPSTTPARNKVKDEPLDSRTDTSKSTNNSHMMPLKINTGHSTAL